MRKVEIDFLGPFGWGAVRTISSIYDSPIAAKGGVYLWTVLTPGHDELVHYVGETRRSFAERIAEEMKDISVGRSRVYDPDRFVHGQKIRLWGGRFARYRETRTKSDFEQIKSKVAQFMEIQRFHLAPVSSEQAGVMPEDELRLRVEAGLAHHFYQQEGVVREFQDEDVQYLRGSRLGVQRLENLHWPPVDATTRVFCHTEAKIRCFPSEIVV